MNFEIKGFRLGDILQPDTEGMSPKTLRLMRNIRESLPKAFLWSDPERRVFVSLEPGPGKDPAPKILAGEYLNVVEMIPVAKPAYTLIHEVESDRTLIFDGNNHWKWKPREGWALARKKNPTEAPVEVLVEVPYEESILV